MPVPANFCQHLPKPVTVRGCWTGPCAGQETSSSLPYKEATLPSQTQAAVTVASLQWAQPQAQTRTPFSASQSLGLQENLEEHGEVSSCFLLRKLVSHRISTQVLDHVLLGSGPRSHLAKGSHSFYMSMFLCVCVCRCRCACTCACVGQRTTLGVIFLGIVYLVLDRVFH